MVSSRAGSLLESEKGYAIESSMDALTLMLTYSSLALPLEYACPHYGNRECARNCMQNAGH